MLRTTATFTMLAVSILGWTEACVADAGLELTAAESLPIVAKGGGGQLLSITGRFSGEPQRAVVLLDKVKIGEIDLAKGDQVHQISGPRVSAETRSKLTIQTTGGTALASAELLRRPVRELTIFIVPHSHVDIGYTQLQPEIEKKQTSNLLRAMEMAAQTRSNQPGERFRWTVEASWTIGNLLRDQPEKMADLVSAVKAGEVELDSAFGNMLTALCRPEELVRAYAWGARYGSQLGVPVRTATISDVPGYTWGTITALSAAGLRYFSIGPNFIDRIGTTLVAWQDRPFYWQSPDGRSKVLCWVSYQGYAWSHLIRTISPQHVGTYVSHLQQMNYPYDLTYIRWSGHGDNAVPDEGLVDSVKRWNETYEWPRLRISRVSEPFEALETRYREVIPTVRGDWTPYWEDGAASSALETGMNRATDERLVAAETLWAMLRPAGQFPADRFRQSWRGALLYSEHTWGAHCSITDPQNPLTTGQWSYKRGYATSADEKSRQLLEEALAGPAVENAVDVFNVNSWARSEVVRVSKELSAAGDLVRSAEGQDVPSQRLKSGELAFLATDVPPMSCRRYTINAGKAAESGDTRAAATVLENSRLRVGVDPVTGSISHLARAGEKTNFVDSRGGGLNEYLYVEADHFSQPAKIAATPAITVMEPGPLVAALRIESGAPGCNRLSRELWLSSASDHIELIDLLDKKPANVKPASAGGNPQDPRNGKEAVHIGFGLNVPAGEIRMDIPMAVVQPQRDQMPGACKNWFTVQRWVDLSNDTDGVTIAPLDTPLVQVGGITATLIGSQRDPEAWQKEVDPKAQSLYFWAMNNYWHTNYRASQEGIVTFRYALRPHASFSTAAAQRFGIERSQPLVVTAGRGRSPTDAPRPVLNSDDVVVSAFKPADDGAGYILRLFAAGGKKADVKLQWTGRAPTAVYESNTLEARGPKAGDVVSLAPWSVVTLRIE